MAEKGKQLYLKPEEVTFLSTAVLSMLADVKESSQNQRVNWTPEARGYFKEMIAAGNGLIIKFKAIGIDMDGLKDYNDGDENEFLTKES